MTPEVTALESFYLSCDLQSSIIIGQRVIFCFSLFFNIIAFVCLIKETPESQANFRKYLLYIQILAAINDFDLDLLFQPFPLFPALGAFCNGVLCQWGVPIQYSFAISVFLIGNIGASILICILYRYQSIVGASSPFSQKTISVFRWCLIVVYSLPGIISFSLTFDDSQTEFLIDNFAHGNLSWVRERGMYSLFVASHEIMTIPIVTLIVLLIAIILLASMLHQIITTIVGESHRSKKAAARNRKAINILMVQLGAPILFLIVPATIMMLSALLEPLIPFQMCLFSFQFIRMYSITHSIVLLLITPAYGRYIGNFLSRILSPKFLHRGSIQTVNVSGHYNVELRRISSIQRAS